jgi:hypothetical protein
VSNAPPILLQEEASCRSQGAHEQLAPRNPFQESSQQTPVLIHSL